MRRIATVIATTAALAGCVSQSAEPKIRDALLGYGVQPRQASCMADELSRKLTVGQLRTLSRVAHEAKHDRYRDRPIADLIRLAERVGDPDLIIKVTRATFGCAILR